MPPMKASSRDVFRHWFDELGRAWMTRNPNVIVAACAENVLYYEDPFQKPLRGKESVRRLWVEVPKTQKDIHFSYNIIATAHETGIAHWSARFTRVPNGTKAALDGIFVVTLNEKGLCKEFHQWWNSTP